MGMPNVESPKSWEEVEEVAKVEETRNEIEETPEFDETEL